MTTSLASAQAIEPALVVVMGAGGHGRSVADALESQRPGCLAGFIDDDRSLIGTQIIGYPVLGDRAWLWEQSRHRPVEVAIGLGQSAIRREVLEACQTHGVRVLTVIHPTAVVAASARLGVGSVILAKAVLSANSCLGKNVIVGTASIIEHDVAVGDFTLLGPDVVTGGGVKIGSSALIGLRAHLLPGVTVGNETIVGAGSLVSRNIPDHVVAYGVPARTIRENSGTAPMKTFDGLMNNATAAASAAAERIFLSPPHLTGREQEFVLNAMATNWVAPVGPHIDGFEAEFAATVGVKHAVAVSSGTAAMHLAVRQLDLQPGDEVYCSTATFAATVNPVLYERGTPVFFDSDSSSWNMDCNLLAEELKRAAKTGRLPRAVISVDLYGQCADWDELRNLCQTYEVPLIEDAAEALGATYKGRPAGSFGWANIFSFNGNKIITTSGGGMLATDDPALASSARHLATQARDPAPHYEHSQIGYNYRMSNLLAGVGRAQLAQLQDRVAARRAVFNFYVDHLGHEPGIEFMPEAAYGRATRWLTCLLIDREQFGASSAEIRQHLEDHNIESRPAWKPMHMQPVFQRYRSVGGQVSERIFEKGLCLPSGSSLTAAEMQRVVETLLSVPRHPRWNAASTLNPSLLAPTAGVK